MQASNAAAAATAYLDGGADDATANTVQKNVRLEDIAKPPVSLLAYGEPFLVAPASRKVDGEALHNLNAHSAVNSSARRKQTRLRRQQAKTPGVSVPPPTTAHLSKSDAHQDYLNDLLRHMFANQEWTNEMGTWSRAVLTEPAGRGDVQRLQEWFEENLERSQARRGDAYAICPVREQLFSSLFDELIRQITVECPERGLLLLRLRDQLRMTMAHFVETTESATEFGTHQSVAFDDKTRELSTREQKLLDEVSALKAKVRSLEDLQLELEREHAERAREQFRRHSYSTKKLKRQLEWLQKF
uniref:Uncharacterized protein n=1 Tax=Phaeomonas parva TaxID=124430 RepID=A0A7S1TZ95_9STRA